MKFKYSSESKCQALCFNPQSRVVSWESQAGDDLTVNRRTALIYPGGASLRPARQGRGGPSRKGWTAGQMAEGFLKSEEAPEWEPPHLSGSLQKTRCFPSPSSDFLLLRLLSGQESVTCLVKYDQTRGEGL